MDHARDMPIEPPDPLNLAKRLRDLRDQTKEVRLDIAALVATDTTRTAWVTAHQQAAAAEAALVAAADSLDPPAPR